MNLYSGVYCIANVPSLFWPECFTENIEPFSVGTICRRFCCWNMPLPSEMHIEYYFSCITDVGDIGLGRGILDPFADGVCRWPLNLWKNSSCFIGSTKPCGLSWLRIFFFCFLTSPSWSKRLITPSTLIAFLFFLLIYYIFDESYYSYSTYCSTGYISSKTTRLHESMV